MAPPSERGERLLSAVWTLSQRSACCRHFRAAFYFSIVDLSVAAENEQPRNMAAREHSNVPRTYVQLAADISIMRCAAFSTLRIHHDVLDAWDSPVQDCGLTKPLATVLAGCASFLE